MIHYDILLPLQHSTPSAESSNVEGASERFEEFLMNQQSIEEEKYGGKSKEPGTLPGDGIDALRGDDKASQLF
ncbi:hypothetical protein PRIPAC_95206 [Pristionchus pacificus]|uniref:Uncharacterized protein n=1 Tax=Pristionchus pacificus TaxID=54126 RepID=A0A2A6BBW3_PRIPA|nr:hypothetical protein PRIPAC_95206 [Pristionchus pacificus]|eukprot:PDM63356.1 hypothetical protein PRIPAC_53713 [Pristionchus pacificus]